MLQLMMFHLEVDDGLNQALAVALNDKEIKYYLVRNDFRLHWWGGGGCQVLYILGAIGLLLQISAVRLLWIL